MSGKWRVSTILCGIITALKLTAHGAIVPLSFHSELVDSSSPAESRSLRHSNSAFLAASPAVRRADTRNHYREASLASVAEGMGSVVPFSVPSPAFTYDFPGTPGSGLAAAQTNAQPAHMTFSDFTRTGVLAASTSGIFDSKSWPTTSTINKSVFTSFTITAAAGYNLTLTQLIFGAQLAGSGPPNGQVSLFLNGSSTAYASFTYSPTSSMTNYTFDFTDVTTAQHATSATFNFYGWNAANSVGRLGFDNVAIYGGVLAVPEVKAALYAPLVPALAVICRFRFVRRVQRRRTKADTSLKRRAVAIGAAA